MLIVIGLLVALVAAALVWWTSGSYRADGEALAAVADADGPADGVVVRELSDGSLAFVADEPVAGLIFYPGGQVQPEAYAPLLTSCARAGISCVLVRPPLDFALLSVDAAEGVAAQLPEVGAWLVGGHSLGGVAACSYLAAHPDDFAGLVLLASYPNDDLSGYAGEVLRLVGSNDGVVSRERYEEARALLPADSVEREVEGGNHAQFGNYGAQDGDGEASISRERQQELTVEAVVEVVGDVR